MPVKVTTAPMSLRLCVSLATSAAASNGSGCRRTAALISSPRHRREERDLAGAGDRGVGLDVRAIDRRADHPWILEGVGIFLAAPRKPAHQVADGLDPRRQLDFLLGLADALAHPRKIQELHTYSLIR